MLVGRDPAFPRAPDVPGRPISEDDMRTLPLALRCYLGVTCIALLALAAMVGRMSPLVLVLGLVPLGALPVAGTAFRQSEQDLRRAKEDAALVRRRGEQLEQVIAVGQ